ncbi:MAG: transporter substrate-binding domain-containing protein [Clostridia bacterium]|nr:transporter substrate-binding domain-containing protein [Clostridia bacterium]
MKRILCLLFALLMVVSLLAGCGSANNEGIGSDGGTKLSDLSGKKIGVMTGSIQAVMMPELVPDATYMEFNSVSDLIVALNSKKIDAFGCDESLYTSMLWEGQAVDRIDEPLGESNYGIIFPKGKKLDLQQKMNEYIATVKADGRLVALEEKWFGAKEPTEFVSYNHLNGANGTITVAINSAAMPFIYLNNNQFVGFDIEFITGFAKEYGYSIQFEDVAFAAILGGVQSEKYDLGMAGITITDEREESMDFSDVYHVEDLAVIIRSEAGANDLSQFNTATLGVVTGSLYGGYSREQFPNAKIKEFNNFSDVLVALKQGKVDGIMLDKPNFNSVARTDKSLSCITVPAYSVEIGFGFQKNDGGYSLQAQMNEFLAKLKNEGKIDELINKWYGETEPEERIPLDQLAGGTKTLNVAIDTTRKPFVYMYEGKPVGFEIEVLYMFCQEYGYNVNISDVSFASGLAGLASEKYDLVCGGLYMTDERKENVNFSDPYMNAEVVMAKYERSGFENFWLSLKDSFEKTFIREQRWKLIVEGIYTTLIISFFSVLGGTLFGFALYMLARSKTKWLSKLSRGFAKVYSTIIAGTPTLVILMILFYIVFTSPDMSGVVVAILGFILTFGSFVYEQLSLTVSGVDNGQLEAAYALGYSRNQTFFRIVLPQAMKMFLPSYSGEIVSLIKATSVVGYIAVNDLTKMGDIIRGNTYEAFFPLIAVAVIYFAITWGVAGLLGILKKKAEPKRRKNKNILKGVVR